MFKFRARNANGEGLAPSRLFNEKTFYEAFERDLQQCRQELIIESPFIAYNRSTLLLPKLERLTKRGVAVTVNTRDPIEHDAPYDTQARAAIGRLQACGVQVLFTGGHHRKLAIVDRGILWEGSLNILSQADSCEIMRRIESPELATEMLHFTNINKFL